MGATGPEGPEGSAGPDGAPGPGVAPGGLLGQVLKKSSSSIDFATSWANLYAADISGLSAFATSTDLVYATGTLDPVRIADGSLSIAKTNLLQSTLNQKEEVANKSADGALGTSDILYPTQKATKTYVDSAVSGFVPIASLAAIATSGSASDLIAGTLPDARLTGNYTNIIALQMSGTLTIAQHILAVTTNVLNIRATTADAADVASTSIAGGGALANTRGAYISAHGNEHATQAGNLLLVSGAAGAISLNGSPVSAFATSTDLANATGTLAMARLPFSGCLIKPSADLTAQNLTANVAIPMDAESYDTGGWHDNATNPSRMTVPAGVTAVEIRGQLAITNGTSGEYVQASIRINNLTTYSGLVQVMGWTTNTGVCRMQVASARLVVAPGDYIELFAATQVDTSVTVAAANTWLSVKAVP
jgi:hypothetical protein